MEPSDILKSIVEYKISVKPFLTRGGAVKHWEASYVFVDKHGLNREYIYPSEKKIISSNGNTLEEAVIGLLKFDRQPCVLKE